MCGLIFSLMEETTELEFRKNNALIPSRSLIQVSFSHKCLMRQLITWDYLKGCIQLIKVMMLKLTEIMKWKIAMHADVNTKVDDMNNMIAGIGNGNADCWNKFMERGDESWNRILLRANSTILFPTH